MFKLLSFFTFIFVFFYFLAFEFVNVKYTSFYIPVLPFHLRCRLLLSFRHLGFLTFRNFNGLSPERANLHNHAKFREDRSIRYCDIVIFVVFQDGDRRHLGFWKIQHFNGLSAVVGQFASSCQISSKSVKRWLRYDDLTVFFQNGGRPPSWILQNSIFLTAWAVKRPILHNRAKFREDRSFRCCNIAIFVFF